MSKGPRYVQLSPKWNEAIFLVALRLFTVKIQNQMLKNNLQIKMKSVNYSGVCAQQLQAVAKGCSVLEILVYVFVLVVNNFVYLLPNTPETEEYISFV